MLNRQIRVIIIHSLGSAYMVDVGSKNITKRMARAVAIVNIGETAYTLVTKNQVRKF